MAKITFKYEPDDDDFEDIGVELSLTVPCGCHHQEITERYLCFMQAMGYTYITGVEKLKDMRRGDD